MPVVLFHELVHAIPDYTDQTPLDIAGGLDTREDTLVSWLRERGGTSNKSQPPTQRNGEPSH